MLAKAQVKFIRGSGKKVRQVVDLIRGMNASEALDFLRFVDKRPTYYVRKVLHSAIANAKVKGFNAEQLYISKIICNPGPSWKRFKAAAFGRAQPILKRTAHIKVELDLKDEVNK